MKYLNHLHLFFENEKTGVELSVVINKPHKYLNFYYITFESQTFLKEHLFFINDPLRMYYYLIKELSETIINILLEITADTMSVENVITT